MKVTTINGEELLKKNVRKIKREDGSFGYFKIGNIETKDSGDCYQINNIFYTVEKKRIVWDHFLKRYVLKTTTIEGVINSNLEIGSFSSTAPTVVLFVNTSTKLICMCKEIAEELKYIEGENKFYYNPSAFTYHQIFPRKLIDMGYKGSLQYNFKNYLEICKKNHSLFKFEKDEDSDEYYKLAPSLFDKYTFGIELETTKGMIPESVYKNLGVMPVRDGSISGLEYVTIPLKGIKGVYTFKKIIENLIKYTDSNYTCSMHVHVGNIPRTMEFVTAMFKFGYYFQNNIFDLFPGYKMKNDGIKRQCYTAPLDDFLMSSLNFKSDTNEKLEEDFTKIIYELSGNHESFKYFRDLNSITEHPSDPQESAKWHMKERYKWLNIIPLVFTNKKTIEYRIFTVPDTIDKAFTFLILSLAITDFVNRNQLSILIRPFLLKKMNVNEILNTAKVSSVVSEVLYHRYHTIAEIFTHRGSFFEENTIKSTKGHSLLPNKKVIKKNSFLEDALYAVNVVEAQPVRRSAVTIDDLNILDDNSI